MVAPAALTFAAPSQHASPPLMTPEWSRCSREGRSGWGNRGSRPGVSGDGCAKVCTPSSRMGLAVAMKPSYMKRHEYRCRRVHYIALV